MKNWILDRKGLLTILFLLLITVVLNIFYDKEKTNGFKGKFIISLPRSEIVK